jgi:hypothetical protein
MSSRIGRVVRLAVLVLAAWSLVPACAGEDSSRIEVRRSKLSTPPPPAPPKPCTLPVLKGTDPKKPRSATCAASPIAAPSTALLSAQQAYLAAWKNTAPSWQGLSEDDQKEKLHALKESFMKGVTP